MNLLAVLAQLPAPRIAQRLGHHVLDGEVPALEAADDVDALLAVPVLEPVVQVELAVADAVEVPRTHGLGKLVVTREATGAALVREQIRHNLNVVAARSHALLGIAMKRLEDLVKPGRGHVANPAAEHEGLNDAKNPRHAGVIDLPQPVVLEKIEQVGIGNGCLERTEPREAAGNGVIATRADACAVMLGELEHVAEQGSRVDAQRVAGAGVVAAPRKRSERLVHLAHRGGLALDGGEVEADEVAHLVVGVELDGVPVLVVVELLTLLVQVHEHEVTDLVGLGEIETRGVEALEDELRVIGGVERDVDDAEVLDGLDELVHAHGHGDEAILEVEIVLGDAGAHHKLGRRQ